MVLLASLGTFAIASGVGADERSVIVVAARDIAPGTRLGPGDLDLARADIDKASATTPPSTVDALVGHTTLAPLAAGDIVQASAVGTSDTGRIEMSFAVSSDRAMGGSLRAGEVVDVLSTPSTGADDNASAAVRDATILWVHDQGTSLGSDKDITVGLALANQAEATALAAAVDGGKVTVVRTNGRDSSGPAR